MANVFNKSWLLSRTLKKAPGLRMCQDTSTVKVWGGRKRWFILVFILFFSLLIHNVDFTEPQWRFKTLPRSYPTPLVCVCVCDSRLLHEHACAVESMWIGRAVSDAKPCWSSLQQRRGYLEHKVDPGVCSLTLSSGAVRTGPSTGWRISSPLCGFCSPSLTNNAELVQFHTWT